jgi:tRNA 5-methylaminomethyl-2-thiouridine biosynthesis bifunctional protein
MHAGARLQHLPRLRGVYAATAYASRGLSWAALGADLLLALIEGTEAPLAPDLVKAVDPGRFALRMVRRTA